MNRNVQALLSAAGMLCVLGSPMKADAAIIIDFDNIVFDGGTVTQSGGNWTGTGVIFDSIFLKDTAVSNPLAGVQCGATNTGGGSADPADTCKLNFNTATNTVTVTAPGGLYNIGADLLPYTADRGNLVAGTGSTVLAGSFTSFGGVGGVAFGGAGVDTKNTSLLAFFGLPANTAFTFANTEIYTGANGGVMEADLVNTAVFVPEPAATALFGISLLGVGVLSRRRRAESSQ